MLCRQLIAQLAQLGEVGTDRRQVLEVRRHCHQPAKLQCSQAGQALQQQPKLV